MLVLGCLTLGACTSLLTANFNDDTVDNPPNKTLPGNPTGDEISYADGSRRGTPADYYSIIFLMIWGFLSDFYSV